MRVADLPVFPYTCVGQGATFWNSRGFQRRGVRRFRRPLVDSIALFKRRVYVLLQIGESVYWVDCWVDIYGQSRRRVQGNCRHKASSQQLYGGYSMKQTHRDVKGLLQARVGRLGGRMVHGYILLDIRIGIMKNFIRCRLMLETCSRL